MINNNLSLNGWFGLLFINVFGSWNGSFGVNTSAGDPVHSPDSNKGDGPMFQFVSTTPGGSNSPVTYSYYGNGHGTTSGTSNDGHVLSSAVKKAASTLPSSDSITPLQKATNQMILPLIGAGLAFLILLAGERHRFIRRH
jgi:hypothetical protein